MEGLFIVSYEIGRNIPGGQLFNVMLTVNTPQEVIQGTGRISQATNPPLNVQTKLEGTFTYMTVMPNETHVLVKAVGFPILRIPPNGGIGPVLLQNVELEMILKGDWTAGSCNYRYEDGNGHWVSIKGAPVVLTNSKNEAQLMVNTKAATQPLPLK